DSKLTRVWMASQGCEGAVKLLGEDNTGQLVRQGQRREGEETVGASGPAGGQAVVAAHDEDQIASLSLGSGDPGSEGGGVHGLARRIEQDLARGGVLGPGIGALGPDLAHLREAVPADTFDEIGGHSVRMKVLRPANKVKVEFHTERALRSRDFERLRSAPEALEAVVFARFGRED